MTLLGTRKVRVITVGVAVGLASGTLSMGLATSATAGPLDPDRSFGHNPEGSVRRVYPHQALGVWGRSTYVAGAVEGGGSGEYYAGVRRFGRHGGWSDSFSGQLQGWPSFPSAVATFRNGRRVFSIGWAAAGWPDEENATGGFGYVAAFQPHRPRGARWGTERFTADFLDEGKGDRGLERLREVPLSSVAAGAIDSHRRVVVVGRHAGDVMVTRLTAKGSIDQSFGGHGYIRLRNGMGTARAFDVAVDNHQRILVAGKLTTSAGRSHGFVARLTDSGTTSDTWSGNGLRLIGAAGTTVRGIERARHGRWLVGYERQRTDKVRLVKLGRHGGQINSFGHHGSVGVRCRARAQGPSLTAVTVSRERAGPDRVAAVMTCKKSGKRHQRAGIWFTSGKPVPALAPSGTGPLPWNKLTVDAQYTSNGKLMILLGPYPYRLTRLHG